MTTKPNELRSNCSSGGTRFSRREVFKAVTTLAASAAGASLFSFDAAAETGKTETAVLTSRATVRSSYSRWIVETTAGKVRGYVSNGIFTFKGIPYGAPTSGAMRFMPPAKPQPWPGVRGCLYWGHRCPVVGFTDSVAEDNRPHREEDAFLLYRQSSLSVAAEDCLRLNVWTPSITSSSTKRPVMVWMHGGGFVAGCSNDLLSYDGENLSRHHDVVVVTHNHRLNIFGYLNLAEFDERYGDSANVGMLDIVAVLEWVRDNISNFGGDPGNVMLFGQSGGGGKVSTLMAMPQAKGLFHRACVESGSILRVREAADSSKQAAVILAQLGISKSNLGDLASTSIERLSHAVAAVLPAGDVLGGWGPSVDGKVLPRQPFDPTAPEISANVPVLIGTNLNEIVNAVDNPDVESFTEADLLKRLTQLYGEKTQSIVDAYRKEYPDATAWTLFATISASKMRRNAFVQAVRKAKQGAAPAYEYLFAWRTPALDGRPGTFHSCEIAFVFDNADKCANLSGGGPEGLALAKQVSDAWVAFARTGNPNHSGMPVWPAYTADKREAMLIDNTCKIKSDPEGEGLRIIGGPVA